MLNITLCNIWIPNSSKDSTRKCFTMNSALKHLTPLKIKIIYIKMSNKLMDSSLKTKFPLKKSPKNTQESQPKLKKLKSNQWKKRREQRGGVKEKIFLLKSRKPKLKLSNTQQKRKTMKFQWLRLYSQLIERWNRTEFVSKKSTFI